MKNKIVRFFVQLGIIARTKFFNFISLFGDGDLTEMRDRMFHNLKGD